MKVFNILAAVKNIFIGPLIIKFEISFLDKTRVNKIISLEGDIKLALAAHQIRIEAPIPGKSYIGIEIDHGFRIPVNLKSVISQYQPKQNLNSGISVPLGKSVTGENVFMDIKKLPHLLIAGTTGSGKSVCLNSIIISLILMYSPEQIRLVLVDPKKTEFFHYNRVPHLLAPIYTDAKSASIVLEQLVQEMDERYTLFTKNKARNIEDYNKKMRSLNARIPYIVAVIDELSDLMLLFSKDVEKNIMRLTQLARACGIHLIVATQRPSTDVITGTVKANIPSRIAFSVSSNIDSRTILDTSGAEKLLGKGDLLYSSISSNVLQRLQGIMVSDREIEKICRYVGRSTRQKFSEHFVNNVNKMKEVSEDKSENSTDPLYQEAKEFIRQQQKASASYLQRHFSIGYNRAARLIDQFEKDGIIGPPTGSSKPRDILI